MKRLSLLAISLIALTSCSSQKTADSPSSSPSGQPIEIKVGKDGWTKLGSYVKLQFAKIRGWQYKGIEVSRFFRPSQFKNNAVVSAGATTLVKSLNKEEAGMPYITYSCDSKKWGYSKGKIIENFTSSGDKKTLRSLLKVDGKYTGAKVFNQAPHPTTGYDPSKGWDKGFVGKSGHGIPQVRDKSPEIASLVANSKSSELVFGDKNKSMYFKFSFQIEPVKLVDDLCAFAMDGKVILPAVAETK